MQGIVFNKKRSILIKVIYLCHMPTTAEGTTSFPGKIEASPNFSAPILKEFNHRNFSSEK
jgi:hypothetical protein